MAITSRLQSPILKRLALLWLVVSSGIFAPGCARVEERASPNTSNQVVGAEAPAAQIAGSLAITGLSQPVEVLRDNWGVPHIYASNTADLFFAQGFVQAQDRMWQMEMWRRNGEGKLAEVFGPDYIRRDTFARTLQYRGDWEEEVRRYHPEGKLIFESFARGVNAAIQDAIDSNKVPIEFTIMGFKPEPVWTVRTILNRMPSWTLTRNLTSEVRRALDVKDMGLKKVNELRPTTPRKVLAIPEGLDLDDIEAAILDITQGANDFRWKLPAVASKAAKASAAMALLIGPEDITADFGSNNWVIGASKSATGAPILANDPHRDVANPSLRYLVHLNAPGWSVYGATEPGLPGVSIGHNEHLAWGFTILGIDQQDLYVEETDPANPDKYLYKGQWLDMAVERESINVYGQALPQEITVKSTRHGPVLYENAKRHRAYSLRWMGAQAGGAGYIGSLNLMQTKTWKEFNDALPRASFIPSFSLVYADVAGNFGYIGVGLAPVRKNWDGLLPVPGKNGQYEWDGHIPFDKLPRSLNTSTGFYNSSNNDVVPRILPGYSMPLGYEYSAPYRYDRVVEVLSQPRKFTVADMAALQQDKVSLPARQLVPLLKNVATDDSSIRDAVEVLLNWDFVVAADSIAATVYEFWAFHVAARAYEPRIPKASVGKFQQFDFAQAVEWMLSPDEAYGVDAAARVKSRNAILIRALGDALTDIRRRVGDDKSKWQWGLVHTADFQHPLENAQGAGDRFEIEPVQRGGDNFTVMLTGGVSVNNTRQNSGASIMFVHDVQDWDRSVALNTPGNSARPESPHYKDLAPLWSSGSHFPMAFTRKKVESVTRNRLELQPARN